MTKAENRQRLKNEAINKIRKIFDPRTSKGYSNHPEDGSWAEQREYDISSIIEKLEKDLKENEGN